LEGRDTMKLDRRTILLVSILIISLIAGTFAVGSMVRSSNYRFEFRLELTPLDGTSESTLLLPVPVYAGNRNLAPYMASLRVADGAGNATLIELNGTWMIRATLSERVTLEALLSAPYFLPGDPRHDPQQSFDYVLSTNNLTWPHVPYNDPNAVIAVELIAGVSVQVDLVFHIAGVDKPMMGNSQGTRSDAHYSGLTGPSPSVYGLYGTWETLSWG